MDTAMKNWQLARIAAQTKYWAALERVREDYWADLRVAQAAYRAAKADEEEGAGSATDN